MMPAGFAERLSLGLAAVGEAERPSSGLGRTRRAHDELADIVVNGALIRHAGDVLGLFSDVGAYSNDRRDLPRVQAEADDYGGRLAELAVRLGLDDAAEVEAAQPTDAAQALVRGLISEGRSLAADLDRHTNALTKERASLAQIERQRSERSGISDPHPLREKLEALAPVLKQLDKRIETQSAVQSEARKLKEAAARLDPAILDINALALVSLPGAETITRFRKEFDVVAEEIGRAEDRVNNSNEALVAIEARLRDLACGRPIPTAETIAAKRQQRDEDWRRLRETLFGGKDALTGEPLVDVISAFERKSSEADRLSDDAASDAERVASHAAETGRLADEHRRSGTAKEHLLALAAREQELTIAWGTVWAPAQLTPLPPAEMAAWVVAANALLERRERMALLCDQLAEIDAAVQGIEPALAALADEAGLPSRRT
ncbi:MAG: hypothetical protein IPP47_06885 [Bryobacterales bacterium]|nr:hypothetical protein [Bryobacterales bacterium]